MVTYNRIVQLPIHLTEPWITFALSSLLTVFSRCQSGLGSCSSSSSPDLLLCDYCLWGTLKSKVCRNNSHSLQELQQNISEQSVSNISREQISEIEQDCNSSGPGELADKGPKLPRDKGGSFSACAINSDETHFWLNGYVNKQNCCIWSEANPQVYVETPLHPEKLTVWCALWAGGIIGPYFFKNDEGHNVTVNGDRYRAMITNFFIPELNNHDV
ncbi:uncharacterized protein TNCV_3547931 [Trichonephila clavipes]|nr:uncharacterized protein TNCV_3547931 [Trichonephila clavipes]